MNQETQNFWNTFLKETNRPLDTPCMEVFYFGHTEKLANELLELVMSGQKRATASALEAYTLDDEQPPQIGDLSIVTDWDGKPYCVIETIDITQLKFKDVTFDICKREGEDDTLESWQEGHINFFTETGPKHGFEFSWDMIIHFEDFEVIYK